MSRIGIKPIPVPSEVTVAIQPKLVSVRGPKGDNQVSLPPRVHAELVDSVLTVTREGDSPKVRALHGLIRSLLSNAVIGVSEGFSKSLEVHGVGYRAKLVGEAIELTVGFSHTVVVEKTEGISFQVKGTTITVVGHDKQYVGEVAAKIRRIRPPDAYKGKGIRYSGEVVKLKPGKAVKTGGAA